MVGVVARLWAPLSIVLLLSACSGIEPERAILGAGKVNPAGANHLIRFASEPIPSEHLARMICPTGVTRDPADHQDDGFVAALACYQAAATASPDAAKRLRNDVQHVIMLRSEQNCGLWKTYLQRGGAINRGTFNVLSVLTGGAGAVVGGQAASILAAASGAASGTGAAIDAAMLHGLTEGLIFPKVDEIRAAQREEIERHQAEAVSDYGLMRALADAVRFHNACNVSAALSAESPAAEFGNQLKLLTAAIAGVQRATVAVAGAAAISPEPAAAADVKDGAMFLAAEDKVIAVLKVDRAASPATVSFVATTPAGATPGSEPLAAFAPRIAGKVLLRAGK